MTAIVGLRLPGHVIIAGDSGGSNSEYELIHREPKTFKVGHLTLGFTGSFSFAQVLQYNMHLSGQPMGESVHHVDEWMKTTLLKQVRTALEREGWKSRTGGEAFLVGYRNLLYRVFMEDGGWQFCRSQNPYDAIGSGGPIALGALHESQDDPRFTPMERAWRALAAAKRHNASVHPPFVFLSTKYFMQGTWELNQFEEFQRIYGKGSGSSCNQ